MEIRLLAPVERPCPDCGRSFVEIADNIDLGYKAVRQANVNVERIVQESMPEIIEGLELLLWESSPDGQRGIL